jgi:DNA-binding PadR family transcriptional regulator
MVLLWYSKKSMTRTMSRRHVLNMLKTDNMSGSELTDAVKESGNDVISPKLVPVMLVKLQEEGLVQKESNNTYVITNKGLESLKSLDAMSKEFQNVAKIMQRTSTLGKFVITEAIDRITMISDIANAANEYDSKEMKSKIPA